VLPLPFKVNLLNFPASPKVCTSLCISHQVINLAAESQTLVLHLKYKDVGDDPAFHPHPQLLGSGNVKDEVQIILYEKIPSCLLS
jgi:hypothetical protein